MAPAVRTGQPVRQEPPHDRAEDEEQAGDPDRLVELELDEGTIDGRLAVDPALLDRHAPTDRRGDAVGLDRLDRQPVVGVENDQIVELPRRDLAAKDVADRFTTIDLGSVGRRELEDGHPRIEPVPLGIPAGRDVVHA